MNTAFFPQTLPEQTALLAQQAQKVRPSFLSSFYLSGGTGLSLQLGHRQSEDLDFFSPLPFQPQALEKDLWKLGTLTDTYIDKDTLNTFVDGVKLQLLEYPYPLLEAFHDWNGIQVSSVLDIGCTKLQTISMRGSKKDFIDLFFVLEKYSLEELFLATQKKYAQSNYSQAHILKSLVYFEDAEGQPLPRMHIDVSWETIKQRLIHEVKQLSLFK